MSDQQDMEPAPMLPATASPVSEWWLPRDFEQAKQMALMLSQSDIVPESDRGKPGNIFVKMAYARQLGLSPFTALADIAVIHGKPRIYGDGFVAVVQGHPAYESHSGKWTDGPDPKNPLEGGYYETTITRKGHEPHTERFSMKDAKDAGLYPPRKRDGSPDQTSPWMRYPKQMCKFRSFGFAARFKFGDSLRGIRIGEEEDDLERMKAAVATVVETPPDKGVAGLSAAIDAKLAENGLAPMPTAEVGQMHGDEPYPTPEALEDETVLPAEAEASADDLEHRRSVLLTLAEDRGRTEKWVRGAVKQRFGLEFEALTVEQLDQVIAGIEGAAP